MADIRETRSDLDAEEAGYISAAQWMVVVEFSPYIAIVREQTLDDA